MDNTLLFCSLKQIGTTLDLSNEGIHYLLSNPNICNLIRKLTWYCSIYDLHYFIFITANSCYYTNKSSLIDATSFVILKNEILLQDIFFKFFEIFTSLQTILNSHSIIFGESSLLGITYSFNFYLSSQLSKIYYANFIISTILKSGRFSNVADRLVTLSKNQQILFSSQISKVNSHVEASTDLLFAEIISSHTHALDTARFQMLLGYQLKKDCQWLSGEKTLTILTQVACSHLNLIELFSLLFNCEDVPISSNCTMVDNTSTFHLQFNKLFVEFPLDLTWKIILELIKNKCIHIRVQIIKSNEISMQFVHLSCNEIDSFSIDEYIFEFVFEHIRNMWIYNCAIISLAEYKLYVDNFSLNFEICLPKISPTHLRLITKTTADICQNAKLLNNCNFVFNDNSKIDYTSSMCMNRNFAKNMQTIFNKFVAMIILIHQNVQFIEYFFVCKFHLANRFDFTFSNIIENHPINCISFQYILRISKQLYVYSLKNFPVNSGKEFYPKSNCDIHHEIRIFLSNNNIFDHTKNISLKFYFFICLKKSFLQDLSTTSSLMLNFHCVYRIACGLPLLTQLLHIGLHLSNISNNICLISNKNFLIFARSNGFIYF